MQERRGGLGHACHDSNAWCIVCCCSCGLIALHGTKGLCTLHVWSNSKPAAVGNNMQVHICNFALTGRDEREDYAMLVLLIKLTGFSFFSLKEKEPTG